MATGNKKGKAPRAESPITISGARYFLETGVQIASTTDGIVYAIEHGGEFLNEEKILGMAIEITCKDRTFWVVLSDDPEEYGYQIVDDNPFISRIEDNFLEDGSEMSE